MPSFCVRFFGHCSCYNIIIIKLNCQSEVRVLTDTSSYFFELHTFLFFVHYFLHTFTNAAILMIIAISVLNFSVKFLVTKHTQIIYFSYNVFKRAENILEKG